LETCKIHLTQLIQQTSSNDVQVRRATVHALSLRGEDARDAVVVLVQACGDADDEVRECATTARKDLGVPSEKDENILASLLQNHSTDVTCWAATLPGRLGEQAAPAVGQLIDAVQENLHLTARQRLAWALGTNYRSVAALSSTTRGDDPGLTRIMIDSFTYSPDEQAFNGKEVFSDALL